MSDRLTQLYITHRAYLSQQIVKCCPSLSSVCPRCLISVSNVLVFDDTGRRSSSSSMIRWVGSPVSLDPRQCLLGLFPDTEIDIYTLRFPHEMLFVARKIIARNWIQAAYPTLAAWLAEINNTLPYKKIIYIIT